MLAAASVLPPQEKLAALRALSYLLHRRSARHAAQARLHALKLPRILNRVLINAQQLRFARDGVITIARIRVAAHPFWTTAASALTLDGLKHLRQIARVVSGTRQSFAPECLPAFLIARTFQKVCAASPLRTLTATLPEGADDGSCNRTAIAPTETLRFGRCAVPLRTRRADFMIHHLPSSSLRFGRSKKGLPRLTYSGARKRERVDVTALPTSNENETVNVKLSRNRRKTKPTLST